MKTLLIGFSLALIFTACLKRVDNSQLNKTCSDSCTTVSGIFTTGNNEPVKNIPVEIASDTRNILGIHTRTIASGKTDANGYYSFTFGLNSDEYGPTSLANIYLRFTYDTSQFLALPVYQDFGNKEYLGTVSRKDTALTASVFLPRKGQVKVRLENFLPVQTGDYFKISSICNAGLNKQERIGYSVEATQNTTEQMINACGDEQTELVIARKKNGIATSTDTTINTPVGQPVTVVFSY